MKKNYKDITIEDIMEWCEKNKKVEWLQKEVAKTTKCKVYPRKKVVNEEGKKVSVADKSQKPTLKSRPITFVQIKFDFCNEFMPELLPKKKEKAPTMYEKIAAMKA